MEGEFCIIESNKTEGESIKIDALDCGEIGEFKLM